MSHDLDVECGTCGLPLADHCEDCAACPGNECEFWCPFGDEAE